MTILNNTAEELCILDTIVKPEENYSFTDMFFGHFDVHSEIGSCIVKLQFGEPIIRNFGSIYAESVERKIIINKI